MAMLRDEVERLAADAARGAPGALDRLLRAIQPEVLRRCGRFLPCQQDAEDACQDALLQVATNLSSFQWRSSFNTWLHTVVSNSARGTYRSLKRRSDLQINVGDFIDQRADPRTTSVIAGSRLDLLDAVEALESTRPHLVGPFLLRDVCQLSYAEIAEHLAAPLGTVKSQVYDARRALQALLADHG